MNTPKHDPWPDRLSEYLDGELGDAERAALEAHLGVCGGCRELLGDLRGIVAAARALGPREPERDGWPALSAALGRRARSPVVPWLLAFAAGVLVALAGLAAWRALGRDAGRGEEVAALGEHYLLLLHEPEGAGSALDPAEHAAVVERYARWARELGERCLGGEELDDSRTELLAGAGEPVERSGGPRIGGYFLLAARDRAEAIAVARTCPHLGGGGTIEVRRIRTQGIP